MEKKFQFHRKETGYSRGMWITKGLICRIDFLYQDINVVLQTLIVF